MNEIGAHNLDECMRTYTGKTIDLICPDPMTFDIRDIAQGLAFKAHFAGQSKNYFSIAQHCLLVCDLLPDSYKADSKMMMLALLHDASEAYIGDMIKPLKVHIPTFVLVEDRIMRAICKRFGIDYKRIKELKPWDIEAQQIEYDNFYNGVRSINYLSPYEAAKQFKLRYIRYYSTN